MNKSNIFIISGPSGSGQDSVIEELKKYISLERIITTTTRDKRPTESEGNPYYFVSKEEFENKIKNNEMAEWAQEYDNFYGVTKEELNRVGEKSNIAIWRIGYKGVITAKKEFPTIKSILIAPPTIEKLKERLLKRDSNYTPEFIEQRMAYSKEFLDHANIYDFKVINEDNQLSETAKKVLEIIKHESN